MTSTGSLDPDGELFRVVRDVVGPRAPVVATVDLGACAALKMGDVTVAVASRRVQCADPAFLESLEIDIAAFRAVVVKSRGHFRAGGDEFFDDSQISEVDAGGLVSPILSRIRFARLPRPVYPLDPETTWTPPRG